MKILLHYKRLLIGCMNTTIYTRKLKIILRFFVSNVSNGKLMVCLMTVYKKLSIVIRDIGTLRTFTKKLNTVLKFRN
ncbi:hypothetical protein ACFP3I_15895 [Chryseobacterium arachidis]|uniref:hypothetical protein n=1 Tax=Chryseobacterium arachidis TaxID=1416778 RepID=UPI003612469A